MKKRMLFVVLAMLLACLLATSISAADVTDSGKSGDNLIGTLYGESELAGVSGTVTSFLSETEPITVQLMSGETEVASTTAVGNTAEYKFDAVAAGTYTLRVSKLNHATREYGVVVGEEDITQDVKIHIIGDIDGDGKINVYDAGKANSHAKKVTFLTGYELICADVDGSGKVNVYDAGRINSHAKKVTFLVDIPETKPNCVRYSDFGAVGDGVTDDWDAIVAAHDYANEHDLPVVADEGATYYIGITDKVATIRTNTTWTGATFIIDDTKIVAWKTPMNILFHVDGDEYVDDFNITSLRKGQKHLGFAPGEDLLVTVENDNVIQYIRRYVDYTAGSPMSDTFVVDAEGNILSDIIWNFDEITSCKAKTIGEPLVIDGGTFLFKVNRHNSQSYYSRNIKIIRSNTTVQNLTMKIIDEGEVGSPYMGFITVIETANVTLKNLKLDAYNSFGGTMGTYAMQINYSANTTLDNVIQTNDILDTSRWGIMNTNFCKDFVVKNCRLNRYDSHMGVTNCTIENSVIGSNGVNIIGHGTFILKDSTVYNDCLLILRADYGATWDGDIYIENVDWYHSSKYPSIIYARNDSSHDFGYTCYQPRNLYIDGLNIYEYNAPSGNNYPRILCYYVRGEEIGTLSPYVLCERVVVNDLQTESGIPTYLSFNEGDYPDTEWEISNSNVIEGYLPRP